MTNLEAFTLFTTGVRVTILGYLITMLVVSLRRTKSVYSQVTANPVNLLIPILFLLLFSLVEVGLEMYDHTKTNGGTP